MYYFSHGCDIFSLFPTMYSNITPWCQKIWIVPVLLETKEWTWKCRFPKNTLNYAIHCHVINSQNIYCCLSSERNHVHVKFGFAFFPSVKSLKIQVILKFHNRSFLSFKPLDKILILEVRWLNQIFSTLFKTWVRDKRVFNAKKRQIEMT